MDASLQAIVARWSKRWWLTPGAEASAEPRALQAEMIRLLAYPETASELFQGFLRTGQFARAEQWLDAGEDSELISRREELTHDLERARARAIEDLEARRGAAAIRAKRLDAGLEMPPFAEIAAEGRRHRATAEARLQAIEKHLAERESVARGAIAAELEQRVAAPEPWRDQVRRYLDAGELELAKWLLRTGPAGYVADAEAPPRMARWPYSGYPVHVVCDWLLGIGQPPAGFANRVDIARFDDAGKRLVHAIKRLWQVEANAAESAVDEFVGALGAIIGDRAGDRANAGAATQRLGTATYQSVLQMPDAAELPGLPERVPIVVRLKEDEADLPSPAAGIALALGRTPMAWPANYIEIRTALLFGLVADAHRRFNFLRGIGAQFPLRKALPEEVTLAHEDRLSTRRYDLVRVQEDAAASFVTGPRGVGKSAFLRAARARMADAAMTTAVLDLDGGDAFASVDAFLATVANRAAAADGDPIIVDASRTLPALVTRHDAEALVAFCDRFRADGGRRLVTTVPAAWQRSLADAGGANRLIALRSLEPHEIRAIVGGFLDVLGIPPAKSELVDRIAFYASGRLSLTYYLMRAILTAYEARGERHRAGIDADTVEAAWRHELFLLPASRLLLEPLTVVPSMHLLLALVTMLCGETGSDVVSETDLGTWWEMYAQRPAGSPWFQSSLDALAAEEMLVAPSGGAYALPHSGIGLIIHHALDVSDAAIAELSKRVHALPPEIG